MSREPSAADLLKYGRPGTPVGRGDLVRAYCRHCGEAIRVTPFHYDTHSEFECENCEGLPNVDDVGPETAQANQQRMTQRAVNRYTPGKGCWQ